MVADDFSASASGLNQQSERRSPDIKEHCDGSGRQARRRVRVLAPEKLRPETARGTCNIPDAAKFLIQIAGPLARGKLQDLLYFAQAWHLVWDNELLFPDPILATDEGVSIPAIDGLVGDTFTISPQHVSKGRVDRLSESQQRTLVGIVKFYAGRNHFRLSEQIREEIPWLRARQNAMNGTPALVDPATLHRYYRES